MFTNRRFFPGTTHFRHDDDTTDPLNVRTGIFNAHGRALQLTGSSSFLGSGASQQPRFRGLTCVDPQWTNIRHVADDRAVVRLEQVLPSCRLHAARDTDCCLVPHRIAPHQRTRQ